jgi:hypothetical protein
MDESVSAENAVKLAEALLGLLNVPGLARVTFHKETIPGRMMGILEYGDGPAIIRHGLYVHSSDPLSIHVLLEAVNGQTDWVAHKRLMSEDSPDGERYRAQLARLDRERAEFAEARA